MVNDKLAKVRAEIERRYNYHKDHADDYAGTEHFWKADEDRELLSFIDSMQEEPTTSVWHDAKEMPPDDIIVFRYIDGLTTCRYVGQTMKDVVAWAYFKDLKKL